MLIIKTPSINSNRKFQLYLIKGIKYFSSKKQKLKSNYIWAIERKRIRKSILSYYSTFKINTQDPEKYEIINYLISHKLTLLPYKFTDEYKSRNVKVHYDKEKCMNYVNYKQNKLYYRKDWTVKKIKKYHSTLLSEQDIRSPHCYLTDSFTFDNNNTFIDAGAAEGLFALSVIEKAKMGYIFEPEVKWIEPLMATFFPWRNKIVIIPKFIGVTSKKNYISLNNLFSHQKIDFLKVDVEGSENDLLKCSSKLLNQKRNIKIVIATYHRQDDEIRIKATLQKFDFNISFSKGYIPFFYDSHITEPYLRRGLIRAEKRNIS